MNLSPQDFWNLSLAEWRWLLGEAGPAGMTREELHALAGLYPDEKPAHPCERETSPPNIPAEGVSCSKTTGYSSIEGLKP